MSNTRKNNFLAAVNFNTAKYFITIHSGSPFYHHQMFDTLKLWLLCINSCSRKTEKKYDVRWHQSLIFAAFLWPNTANENKATILPDIANHLSSLSPPTFKAGTWLAFFQIEVLNQARQSRYFGPPSSQESSRCCGYKKTFCWLYPFSQFRKSFAFLYQRSSQASLCCNITIWSVSPILNGALD